MSLEGGDVRVYFHHLEHLVRYCARPAETGADGTKQSHDTSRIAWAKLLAKIAESFPLVCPVCGGDIRLTASGLKLDEEERMHACVGSVVALFLIE